MLRHGSFRRFMFSQALSSLGDWIGLVAILAVAGRITEDEFVVASMLLARLAPALLFGPIAGVMVDRFNRKHVMVLCDLGRGALILTLPFIETVSKAVPWVTPVVLLLVVSAALEMLTLLWQPAKDSSVPDMIPANQLTHANSAVLLAAYGTFPVSGAAFGALAATSKWLADRFELFREFSVNQEHLAFFFDGFTFALSAILVATLSIPHRRRAHRATDLRRVWTEFVDGLRFIVRHPLIRPWVLGIGMIFLGIGAFFALVYFHMTQVLGAGSAGFGLMITAVGIGLGSGFVMAGAITRFVPKDIFFSVAVFGMGASLIVYASVSTLASGLVVAVILGLFAGFSYPSGLTLVQENTDEELRGRTLGSMHSVVRLALVSALAAAPALSKIIDGLFPGSFSLLGQQLDIHGTRVVLWMAGLSIVTASLVTSRAVSARWRGLRLSTPGIFLVFEGGEGTGKSTQIRRLAAYLTSRGREVVVTREPGGTEIGRRIRALLLDPTLRDMSSKTEALLYAADRAQHVGSTIRPALREGKIVISDRYVDSSLAYQGYARRLGIEKVLDVSRWATDDLMPDLVFLLDFDTERGLERAGPLDRLELEGLDFHELVRRAYHLLAQRYPGRFAVIDASRPPEEIEAEIVELVRPYLDRVDRDRVSSGAPS